MAKLSAISSLNGYDKDIGNIRLREVSNQSLIAMAIPQGGETKFKNSIKNIFGLKMPTPSKSVKNKDTRILSTQPDQIFVLTKRIDDPEKSMAIEFDGSAYITDQTDAWVILEISGSSSREALERICLLDLDKEIFQLDSMARTSMEHMSAIIIRKAEDTFYLMSASSSAKSFLHALELSAQHVS